MIRCLIVISVVGAQVVLLHQCAAAAWPDKLPGSASTITKAPVKFECLPLPKSHVGFAESIIKNYPHDDANQLPWGLRTESEIIAWIDSLGSPSGTKVFECFKFGDYLFVTLQGEVFEIKGDPANLGASVIVNLRKRTCIGMFLGRS